MLRIQIEEYMQQTNHNFVEDMRFRLFNRILESVTHTNMQLR